MPVKTFRPLTPSTRYITIADFSDITKTKPEKSLVEIRKKTGGRNHYGRATARGIGGGHKQKIRIVDFKRQKHGVEATVSAIEYDPIRTARLALLEYKDGVKAYIVAPAGLQVGAKLNHREASAALAAARNPKTNLSIVPGVNHLFQTCETGDLSEYATIEETFSPNALSIFEDWLGKQSWTSAR